MSHPITLLLPDELASIARAEADRSSRPLEIVLLDWIRRGGEDDLHVLSDDDLLSLCDSEMSASQQSAFSHLQGVNREGELTDAERSQFEALMLQYQAGLLRKAKAWKVAADRGLRSLATSQ